MPNNPAAPYKFVYRAEQRQQLKTWAARATARGRKQEYVTALKIIHQQLTTEPLTWGEPWYRLHHLGLQVFQRVCMPLHISYAVDEPRRIVYVKKLTPLSGSGLE
jgi:hypothetical protein